MSKSINILYRAIVQANAIEEIRPFLETTNDRVWLSHTQSATRYTFKGVPARIIDVSLTEKIPNEHQSLCVEIGEKIGKHDSRKRLSLTIRCWWKSQTTWKDSHQSVQQVYPNCRLWCHVEDDEIHVACTSSLNNRWWGESFKMLRSDLNDYDIAAIPMWHWNRYYQHIPFEDAKALADSFEILHPETRSLTLAEANRLASRDLYRLSVDLGWKKLTDKDRRRINLANLPSWVRADEFFAMLPAKYHKEHSVDGTGEYTREAARGERMTEGEGDGFIRTSHGIVAVE